ncbi:MAG: YidC/Oxa1 family membrane protein insertase, partial [Clostridia bacterium]|nr:YidC/Oxa1 family membrane protein insertase [Clostridia bacterium]
MYYICYPFGILMKWCWELVHNYGLAIILFTVLTRIVLLPISVWVHKNSIKIVKIQPEVNFLKVRFFGDRERIAEEESKLHKREKYNPLLSILPLVIQIILLFAVLYIVKEPLTYIFNISSEVRTALAGQIGITSDIDANQFAIIRAVIDGRIIPSSQETTSAIELIKTFDLDFIGIRLDNVASQVWGWYTLVPFAAGLSSFLMIFVQNKCNVVQAEQGKF